MGYGSVPRHRVSGERVGEVGAVVMRVMDGFCAKRWREILFQWCVETAPWKCILVYFDSPPKPGFLY